MRRVWDRRRRQDPRYNGPWRRSTDEDVQLRIVRLLGRMGGLIAGLVVRYRGQLVEYADAVRALNPGFDVRTALFIPAFGHLEVVDTATEEAAA